ncbi:hypothetical protein KMW28_00435 [Flammeovirga yaeyamensis]|uniref:Phosphoribosyltransferase domain-containing protein n=1 Tax=Flammeovirga yaeyamensis TaxID=367791 RepID=A0AAX1N4G6_9BACT|nr:phosphoribosyltransferase family protein [Flammeovirga yaeyamensis]MBB3700668.1 ComF family protein [Flammeovirga yaeyamensis]NMF37780.1 ComF family protein [Flammeovirga yaeyamensis]QWG02087.1 hypothetical protein KMW28_00435 [Flammeovirga yaeyamensis]
MTILKEKIFNLFYAVFPKQCLHCNEVLAYGEEYLCFNCYCKIPIHLGSWNHPEENIITNQLISFIDSLKYAVSFFYYESDGIPKSLIHSLKYKNQSKIGEWVVNHFHYLLSKELFDEIDCIVPVPLHPKKKRERGYNQVSTLCDALSNKKQIKVDEQIIQRVVYTKSQTKNTQQGRMENMKEVFKVYQSENIKNKNILIVDDVLTTGATLIAVAEEIEKYQPTSISILTLAVVV